MTKPYTLTPEFFARTRERLAQRKAELIEHLKEMQAIDERIAQLDADERLAADLATRYEADIAADLPKRRDREVLEIGETGPAEPHDSEPSSSEKPEISVLTASPHKALTGYERAPPPKPKRGRVVEGIVDDGPGRPRYYDPIAHASREPR